MTLRETEMMVEETVEVQVCDECGIGNDEGELVTYTPQSGRVSEGYEPLHYHPSCLDDLDARTSSDGIDVKEVAQEATGKNIALAMDTIDALIAGMAISVAIVGAWQFGVSNDLVILVATSLSSACVLAITCLEGVQDAGAVNRELRRRVGK